MCRSKHRAHAARLAAAQRAATLPRFIQHRPQQAVELTVIKTEQRPRHARSRGAVPYVGAPAGPTSEDDPGSGSGAVGWPGTGLGVAECSTLPTERLRTISGRELRSR